MKPLVLCVWVSGHANYGAAYVRRLRSMVSRHLDCEYDFVCLTDRPDELLEDRIETIEVPRLPDGVLGWWSKVWLFSPHFARLRDHRCLYLDLDSVVTSSLKPILNYPAKFALIPDGAPNFRGKGARVVVKRFNSSVMVWDGGQQTDLFTQFDYSVTERLWGDQDWIAERRAGSDVATLPIEWFPRLSQCEGGMLPQCKVLLCKKPKPEIAAAKYRWIREAWV